MKKGLQSYLFEIFYDPRSKRFVIVNDFLSFITLLSIAGIVLETVETLGGYMNYLTGIEYIAVFFFTLEYIGRLIANKKKLKYIFSFYGIVDLIAILPTFIGFANLTFLKSVRIFRIIRLLRLTRLAKITRIRKDHHVDPEDYAAIHRINFQIYFLALFASVIIFGSVIYLFEAHQHNFSNIPMGMLWAVETVLGGFPTDRQPETLPGRLTTIFARFVGLVLFGLLISVVGNTVRKFLFGTKKV